MSEGRNLTADHGSSRLRTAAFAPIGDEGRAELIETRIVRAISCGALIEGERLPSETELSQLFGVAVLTVREALMTLRHRGMITTKRGRNGGSFVCTSSGAVVVANAETLTQMSQLDLADLGLWYEAVAATCAEYACRRATDGELDAVQEVLLAARDLPPDAWRRRITDVQLELAALSQSVRLTSEHVSTQAEFTPLLTLQDADLAQRHNTHDALLAQLNAIRAHDIELARSIVRESIRGSVRWLSAFRNELLTRPTGVSVRDILGNYRSRTDAGGAGEAA